MVARAPSRVVICSLAVLTLLVAGGGLAATPGGVKSQSDVVSQSDAARPNILVIVTDDQRADTLRVMPKTRHYFRRNGKEFPNSFVSTPLCCPSRASIFSGRYAHNHGIFRTSANPANFDQEATLQARLHDAGYSTAIAGKYIN